MERNKNHVAVLCMAWTRSKSGIIEARAWLACLLNARSVGVFVDWSTLQLVIENKIPFLVSSKKIWTHLIVRGRPTFMRSEFVTLGSKVEGANPIIRGLELVSMVVFHSRSLASSK